MHDCAEYRELLLHNLCIACRPFACSVSLIIHMCIIHVTIVLGDLCDNIGLVGISASFTTMFTVVIVGVFTEKYVHTEFHLDWLLCERVAWPSMSLS